MKEIEDKKYPMGEVVVLKDLIVSVIPSNVTVKEYTSFNINITWELFPPVFSDLSW